MSIDASNLAALARTSAGLRRSGVLKVERNAIDPKLLANAAEDVVRFQWAAAREVSATSSRAIGSPLDLLATLRRGNIFFEQVNLKHPALADLTAGIRALGWRTRVNMYLSAAMAEPATTVHRDGDDLVVVQLYGRKQWCVGQVERVAHGWRAPLADHLNERELVLTENFELLPGDIAFLPRGTPHQAHSLGPGPSVHITIMGQSLTPGDALLWIVKELEESIGAWAPMESALGLVQLQGVTDSLHAHAERLTSSEEGLLSWSLLESQYDQLVLGQVLEQYRLVRPARVVRGLSPPTVFDDGFSVGGVVVTAGTAFLQLLEMAWSSPEAETEISELFASHTDDRALVAALELGALRLIEAAEAG